MDWLTKQIRKIRIQNLCRQIENLDILAQTKRYKDDRLSQALIKSQRIVIKTKISILNKSLNN